MFAYSDTLAFPHSSIKHVHGTDLHNNLTRQYKLIDFYDNNLARQHIEEHKHNIEKYERTLMNVYMGGMGIVGLLLLYRLLEK